METNVKESKSGEAKVKESKSAKLDVKDTVKSKDFNFGWSLMKVMVYFFGIILLVALSMSFFFAYKVGEEAGQRAYIITNAGTMLAEYTQNGDKKSREVELRNHINLFFNKMYAFNEYTYKENIEQALHLIGPDGKRILSGYNQANAYNTLVTTSANVTVAIDSVWVDMESNPYRAKAFVRQFLSTPQGTVTKKLWTEMNLRDLGTRSPENIHGLLIENISIFDNSTIENTAIRSEEEEN